MKQISLTTRIDQIRAEIDAFLDTKVAEQRALTPGIPDGVLRNLLIARAPECKCRAYLGIVDGKT